MRRTMTAVAAALVLLSGCTGGGSDRNAAAAAAASSSAAVPPAEVSLTPEDGATDVPPTAPVEISVTGGRLGDVTVVDGDGAAVTGRVAPGADGEAAVWTPEQPLAYGTEYTATAVAGNDAGKNTEVTAAFSTVTPDVALTPSIGPLDGTTVGVGMPIRVYFGQPVTEKAAVERHLTVTTPEPTDGTWDWFSDTEVHFRPEEYWPANIDVTLDAALYGVQLADGVWGAKDRSITFSVGDRHVSVADAVAHTLDVYDGADRVRHWPMSAGNYENPTRNGAHVVTESFADITMDSSTFGLAVDAPGGYRTDVKYAVRINNNGEFVHAAPWSLKSQGKENVSHGCINLSTEDAKWFFDFSRPGDVVEVQNSIGPTLASSDGDIYDWAVPWDEWQAGSALK